MKTTIWYFTGTGNTLAVVRELAQEVSHELGDTELVPMVSVMQQDTIVSDADAVGIAFPVYFLGIPALVRHFLQKTRFTSGQYVFGIATCGQGPGPALFDLKALLEEKGATLSAGFVFIMPENYIGPVDLMGDAPHRQEKYAAAKSRIPAVAEAIRERKQSVPEGNGSALQRFGGNIARTLMTTVYGTPLRLHATDRCNQCRTCERVCPTRNITVVKDAVHWGKNCTLCYACIHWCPTGAIEIGGRTTGKPRYHHPDVRLADMLHQRGDA
jgi:ferredoxin